MVNSSIQSVNSSNRKCAFTLAEVLITLGIIGVVASMTIPTLIQDYNERVWNTAAKVFERKLEESLKTMNTQQTLAGHSTTESFVEELSKHFKTNKICQNDELLDCFPETVYWGAGEATPQAVDMSKVKIAENFGQDDWDTNIISVLFANGVSAMIAYNPTNSCTQDPYSNLITGQNCLAILYDTSAFKNPNTSGKDLRANANVLALNDTLCAFEINGVCYGQPFYPTPISYAECESIKDDLEISGCAVENDYWAGAVKTCGGVGKMPTASNLADIANFMYNTNKVNGMDSVLDLERDDDKAGSLGFSEATGNSSLYIWSNEEESAGSAYFRNYNPTLTYFSTFNRDNGNQQAVCIIR